MPHEDSEYRRRALAWPALYGERFRNLGAGTTIFGFGDGLFSGKANAATFLTQRSDSTGLEATVTPSEALSAFDTAFDLTNPANWQGNIPFVTTNGTDEAMTTPDAAGWQHLLEAFSVVAWVNLTDATSMTIMSKYDLTTSADAREWRLFCDASDKLNFEVYDETADAYISRLYNTALSQNRWLHITATYDGGTASSGIKLYVNGAAVDDTTVEDGVFVTERDTAALVRVGAIESTGGVASLFFEGKLAGGPGGLTHVTATALTAAQVKNDYRLMVHSMALG